jgi:hypothetical protein
MTPVSFAAAALLALLAGAEPEKAAPDPRDFGPGSIDVTSWPEDQQRRYEVASVKCAKCHPFARAVNSHYSTTQWKKYMKKMLRRPNSGINEEQAQHIYEFLKFRAAKEGLAD